MTSEYTVRKNISKSFLPFAVQSSHRDCPNPPPPLSHSQVDCSDPTLIFNDLRTLYTVSFSHLSLFLFQFRSKREVPRGVRNSKFRRQDKFRRDWSRHWNTCKSQSGTGPGVRRSKRPLLACRTRCICSMET